MDASLVSRDPEVMSGALCIAGTRVPVQGLFDYLEGSSTLEDFLGAGDVLVRSGRVEVDIHTALEWITLNWVSLSILGKLVYLMWACNLPLHMPRTEVHAHEVHAREVHVLRCTPVRCTPMRARP